MQVIYGYNTCKRSLPCRQITLDQQRINVDRLTQCWFYIYSTVSACWWVAICLVDKQILFLKQTYYTSFYTPMHRNNLYFTNYQQQTVFRQMFWTPPHKYIMAAWKTPGKKYFSFLWPYWEIYNFVNPTTYIYCSFNNHLTASFSVIGMSTLEHCSIFRICRFQDLFLIVRVISTWSRILPTKSVETESK